MGQRPSPLPANIDLSVLGKTMLEAAQTARIGVTVTLAEPTGARHVYVNEVAAEIMGCTVEELLATDPTTHVAPEDLARQREEHLKRSRGEGGQSSYEVLAMRKDGRRVPLEVAVTSVVIDGRPAVFAFVLDISERKAAEELRGRTEARFRELIESVPEPIGIIRDAHFSYANRAFVTVLGYPSAEELYRVPLTGLVHPDEASLITTRSRLIIEKQDPLPPQTYRARRHDGSTVLLEMSSVPFEHEGRPSLLTIARDVTMRTMLERQLVQSDRLAALGTMAAGVAHEINNPLAYMVLNLDWIARKLSEGALEPSSVQALVEVIREARGGADRVAAIVRELRSFSRADADTRDSVDLAAVVQSAIKMSMHELQRRATVKSTFAPVRPVWANEARLEQVVLNLLLNAAQAMPEMRFVTNEIRVCVRANDDGRAVLEVADNGEGIPPEVIPRIFDPFFTTKPPGVGTGLGLSICHGIVSSLGGRITVHSEPGEGTTFHVVLPTTDAQRVAGGAARSEPPEPNSGLPPVRSRVLVVDDEVTIANALRDLLGAEHDVVATTSAREALAVLDAQDEFDVLFCDLMMPGMSGIELYEKLRDDRPGLERRIVFMTGGAFTTRAAEFLARVDNRRIEKPFSLKLVEGIVREMGAATQ